MASIRATIQHRLLLFRAKKIEQLKLDLFGPALLIPTLLFIASYNIHCTILVLLAIPILGGHLYLAHLLRQSETKLFFTWGVVSIFLIFFCLECLIVPLMVVSPWENISFYLLLVGILFSFRIIQRKAKQSARGGLKNRVNDSHTKSFYCMVCSHRVNENFTHCGICHVCVYDRSHHNAWISCCISAVNRKQFVVLLVLLLCWLCFSSYLIFTAVCKSSLLNNIILIPDDCSHTYSSFRTSFSFVGAAYSLEIAVFVFVSLIFEAARTIRFFPCY